MQLPYDILEHYIVPNIQDVKSICCMFSLDKALRSRLIKLYGLVYLAKMSQLALDNTKFLKKYQCVNSCFTFIKLKLNKHKTISVKMNQDNKLYDQRQLYTWIEFCNCKFYSDLYELVGQYIYANFPHLFYQSTTNLYLSALLNTQIEKDQVWNRLMMPIAFNYYIPTKYDQIQKDQGLTESYIPVWIFNKFMHIPQNKFWTKFYDHDLYYQLDPIYKTILLSYGDILLK